MTVGRQQEVAFTRVVLVGSLLVSLALGVVATGRGELSPVALVALALAVVLAWLAISRLARAGHPVTWLLSLGVLNLFLLLPELVLRVDGFRYDAGVELQLSEQKAFSKLVREPDLFWTYDPERPEVNSWGFEGGEIESPKPPGVFRVLFLGDSCADLGRPPYPEVVEQVLNEGRGPSGRRVESVSLAIVGYTSHQGLVAARRYGSLVDPDVVVLHYGWNDHWLAYGGPDHEVAAGSALAATTDAIYSSSRLLQFVHSLRRVEATPSEEPSGPVDLRHLLGSELRTEPRVPAARYRGNLLELAAVFEAMDVPVVFVTPPSAHGALGVPRHFVELSYAVDDAAVTGLHDEYNRIVREVARESGERLFDLERSIDALPAEQVRRIFLFDGIHYSPDGCRYVGRQVAEYLRAELDP